MLSPISETTEPGASAGNSLNNSMSSTHDQQEFRIQGHSKGGMDINLSPPKAQTPRKENKPSVAKDDCIPRGSYIISDANHTPESAFAAGIPVVERASHSSTSRSSEGELLYGSGFLTNGSHEQSNDACESSNVIDQQYTVSACSSSNFHEQQYPSGTITRKQTAVPEQRDEKRFLTFTKSKSRDGKSKVFESKDSKYSTEQYGDIDKRVIDKGDIHKGSVKTFSDSKNSKKNTGPTITWFTQAKNEERSVGEEGGRLESTVRKTNWGEMAAEVSESSSMIEKGRGIFLLSR